MRPSDEHGGALVIVMAAILLLSTLGGALILATSVETAIAGHFRDGTAALYAADAILERAAADLAAVADWSDATNGSVRSPFVDGVPAGTRSLAGGAQLDLDRLVNETNCGHAAACSSAELDAVTTERSWGVNNPRWRPFAYGTMSSLAGGDSALYVVALVGDDGSENDGDPERDGPSVGGLPSPGNGIVELRGEAFGPGGVRRSVQATVTRSNTAGLLVSHLPTVRVLAWREVH